MEIFRTLVQPISSEKKIHYGSKIVLAGSCFSENIGHKLEEAKFEVENNPFGVVYNPSSVKRGIARLMQDQPYTEADLFLQEGLWCSFDHHSRFCDIDKEKTLHNINSRLNQASSALKNADFLFLTFGTAYVYELTGSSDVVSNCHKMPANAFNRRRLTVNEIVDDYVALYTELMRFNPLLTIVFTVSPVRHWKDGAHENQVSKATLLLAIDQLCKTTGKTHYFSSYELMMDDLRDYRFYEEDMLHPNHIAINYIWQRFRDTFFTPDTNTVLKEVEKVIQAFRHKPFNSSTEAFQSFAQQQLDKIHFLQVQYGLQMKDEIDYFKSFLMR